MYMSICLLLQIYGSMRSAGGVAVIGSEAIMAPDRSERDEERPMAACAADEMTGSTNKQYASSQPDKYIIPADQSIDRSGDR
jgi:hypothetical protein